MYRIGDFSKMTKLTVKTLRYYDEVGLLKPVYINSATGYRFYATRQLITLQKIVALKQLGLSIQEIKEIMSGNNLKKFLEKRKLTVQLELDQKKDQLSRIETILSNEEEIFMKYQVTIKELPHHIVYYKQGVVPNFQELQDFILESGRECGEANPGLKCIEPNYCYISYLDGEFKDHDIAVEYAQAVERKGKETDTIKFKEIYPVMAVSVFCKGSYEQLPELYAFIYNWIQQNGYEPIESPRECYIDGVWNKEHIEDWLTEVQIPIKK